MVVEKKRIILYQLHEKTKEAKESIPKIRKVHFGECKLKRVI